MQKKIKHEELKKMVEKVILDCKALAKDHVKNWRPVKKHWETIKGAVYLRLSDNAQVAVERGSLEQQIHIAVSEAQLRSEQERINYRITDFYIEPGVTGTHDNRPEFIRLQQNIDMGRHQFVIFKEISRLVRDLEIWKRFFRLCQKNDCEICIRGLPFNINDPNLIMQLDHMASFAEFESRTTSKRVKESNHSALVTASKFNGNHPLLGFDMTKNQFGENSGIYKPNQEELKQVKWIMTTFLSIDRYKNLIDLCNERNIKSKQGRDFKTDTIKALLQNPRYIGKWYRNVHNKGKRQNKLMPYDRYTEVELSHGPVIDKELWDKVQNKVQEIGNLKAKSVKRHFPLSGLLCHQKDGSSFVGSSSWGRNSASTYYYNTKHGSRIKTQILEDEAKKVLQDIVSNSSKFQKSLKCHSQQKDDSLILLKKDIKDIEAKMEELSTLNDNMEKRLDFLLDAGDNEALQAFKEDCQKNYTARKQKIEELERKKEQLLIAKNEIRNLKATQGHYLQMSNDALRFVTQKDFLALKSVYRNLFKRVIVKYLSQSKIELEFVLNGPDTSCPQNCILPGLAGNTLTYPNNIVNH